MQVPLDYKHGRYKMSFRKVYRDVLSVGIACWTHRRYTVYETIDGTVGCNVVLMLLISLYYDLTCNDRINIAGNSNSILLVKCVFAIRR
jgi:hypothetical protein